MSEPKLFVALTTTHGTMQSRFVNTMLDLFKGRTFDMAFNLYIDPYMNLARNTAAADTLDSDCTHLMFVDADILDVNCTEHIARMVSHDEDIVGGLYPKKNESYAPEWVCNALPERPTADARGLLSLRHIGTGFLLIKRGVFEKMVEELGDEIGYLDDITDRPLWDFFDMPRVIDSSGKKRKMSEDWHFCDVARKLGFKVWGDTKFTLRHIGTAVFPLKTQVAATRQERLNAVA